MPTQADCPNPPPADNAAGPHHPPVPSAPAEAPWWVTAPPPSRPPEPTPPVAPWWVEEQPAAPAPIPVSVCPPEPARPARSRPALRRYAAGGALFLAGLGLSLMVRGLGDDPPAPTRRAQNESGRPSAPVAQAPALPPAQPPPARQAEPLRAPQREVPDTDLKIPPSPSVRPPPQPERLVNAPQPEVPEPSAPAKNVPAAVMQPSRGGLDWAHLLTAQEEKAVLEAIERGIAYLRRTQRPGGAWNAAADPKGAALRPYREVGYAALPGLTLLECGVPAPDPAIQKAADFVRASAPTLEDTYQLSLAVLFLDRLGDPRDRALLQTFALRLLAGQRARGGWGYLCPLLEPTSEHRLLHALRAGSTKQEVLPELNTKSAKHRSGVPGRTFTEIDSTGGLGDNSNTQFALLALWAARRQGVPVDQALTVAEKRFRLTQGPRGGWGYTQTSAESGSMTCAGLTALALGRGVARGPQTAAKSPEGWWADDKAITRGLRALGHYLDHPGDQRKGRLNTFYLWALARVGMLYDQKAFGGKEWYRWGARALAVTQLGGGRWYGNGYSGSTPVLDTCMALLFLQRANLTADLTARLRTPRADASPRDAFSPR